MILHGALEGAYEVVSVLLQRVGGAFYQFELFDLLSHDQRKHLFQNQVHVRDAS
jgi:hypothetical protein